MASTYLSKTNVSQTLNSKFTISVWVKRAELSSSGMNAICGSDSTGSHATQFFFDGPSLRFFDNYSSTDLVTNRKFRDTSAWYHLVAAIDTSQSTAADRVKIYVNGTQETSFATSNYPTQNSGMIININGYKFYVGTAETADGNKFGYFDGCMSHFHFSDGQALAPTVFGSTDASTGEWKINTNPSFTLGNNGFTILKDANTITDQSSNSNNFTLGAGTLTQTADCPSNVFCTWNANKKMTVTLSNGNTTTSGNGDNGAWGTLGNNSGKWYWETQQNAGNTMMGILHEDVQQTTGRSDQAGVYGVQDGTTYAYYRNNGSSGQSSGFAQITNSAVLCHALDLDNGKYYLGVNGSFTNLSGTTSDISAGTNPTFSGLDTTKFWFPFTECRGNGAGCDANFGNGYFGTTAVSSVQNPSSGDTSAKFEYTPPTGFQPITTKGFNE